MHQIYKGEEQYLALASAVPNYSLRPIITVSKPDLCINYLELFERFKKRSPSSAVKFQWVRYSVPALPRERA